MTQLSNKHIMLGYTSIIHCVNHINILFIFYIYLRKQIDFNFKLKFFLLINQVQLKKKCILFN